MTQSFEGRVDRVDEHVQVAVPVDRHALLGGEILELRRAGGELFAADHERCGKAPLRGEFQLLPELPRLGEELDRHASGAERCRDP